MKLKNQILRWIKQTFIFTMLITVILCKTVYALPDGWKMVDNKLYALYGSGTLDMYCHDKKGNVSNLFGGSYDFDTGARKCSELNNCTGFSYAEKDNFFNTSHWAFGKDEMPWRINPSIFNFCVKQKSQEYSYWMKIDIPNSGYCRSKNQDIEPVDCTGYDIVKYDNLTLWDCEEFCKNNNIPWESQGKTCHGISYNPNTTTCILKEKMDKCTLLTTGNFVYFERDLGNGECPMKLSAGTKSKQTSQKSPIRRSSKGANPQTTSN